MHVIFAAVVMGLALTLPLGVAPALITVGAGLGVMAPLFGARFQRRFTRLMGVAILIQLLAIGVVFARQKISG